uniref:Membrane magnesium transporter n=2 Tax=Cyprinus carpio TaxID=7962 RepID=A0A8C1K4H2_CYPCA
MLIPHSTQIIILVNNLLFCRCVSLNARLKWQRATGSAISAAVMTQRSLRTASRASIGCARVKMASSFWKGVVGVGLFALAHAAFSAAQHRSYMRLTEKENETLPIDIVLQTLLSFVITCYGIVHISGEFKDMDASSELKNKTFDTLRNHPSFYLFNHRGRVLFRAPEQEPSTPSAQALPSNPLRLRKLENYH